MSRCASGLGVAENQKKILLKIPKRPFIIVNLEGDKDLIQEVKGFLETVLDWKITEDEERYASALEHLIEGDKTIQVMKKILAEHNWLVTDYGSEYLSEETKRQLQSNYSLTNLYVRTKPDLLAIRDGFSETYLLECKDLTKQGQKTGNLAIEAIPWFISRYLYKIGVNYLYATDLNGETKILKADAIPFTTITTIFLPSLHKEFFKKQVLSKLEKAFPQTPFNLRELEVSYGSSGDPFILIPTEMISNYGRSLERFAKWGWRDGTNN